MDRLVWTARVTNRRYTGNVALLSSLHEMLKENHIVALGGIGGMGKTELGVRYINRYFEYYKAIVWFDASSLENINEQLLLISRIKPEILNKLYVDTERTLLILDNVEDMGVVNSIVSLPRWKGHMLLITRVLQAQFPVLLMPPLPEQDGALLLLRVGEVISEQGDFSETSKENSEAALEIAREVGGFPLALEQMGDYLRVTSPTTLLRGYQAQRVEYLSKRLEFSSSEPNVVDIVQETVACLGLKSQRVLHSLPHTAIHERKIDKKALDDLLGLFLVQRANHMVSMHPLVRAIVQETPPPKYLSKQEIYSLLRKALGLKEAWMANRNNPQEEDENVTAISAIQVALGHDMPDDSVDVEFVNMVKRWQENHEQVAKETAAKIFKLREEK